MLRGACLLLLVPVAAQAQVAPPNVPATLRASDARVVLTYGGAALFDTTVVSTGAAPDFRRFVETVGDRVTQVFKWTAARGTRLTLTGVVRASTEAFAAEVEPREDALPVVRHAVGPVTNLLNRAVYDRRSDWVLSIDFPAKVEIAPTAAAAGATATFTVTASGGELAIRFRPRYYQRHRGLAEFRPWTYRPWDRSVAGWTSKSWGSHWPDAPASSGCGVPAAAAFTGRCGTCNSRGRSPTAPTSSIRVRSLRPSRPRSNTPRTAQGPWP